MALIYVVIPAFNEADNLEQMVPRVLESLSKLEIPGKVLVADDGSTDGTERVISELTSRYANFSCVRTRRNLGKAAALEIGFSHALASEATVLVMMDADGQDDPDELPKLISELDLGFDLVTGCRNIRNDRFIKRWTSKIYNKVTGVISGAPGKDFNSGFKAMTAETAANVRPLLYGELHRYITVIAYWLGYQVSEVPVLHHERMHGKTKYGINRFWRGFIDLLTVRFLMSYENRPSHLFGGIGSIFLSTGSIALSYLLVIRLSGTPIGGRPLLSLAVLLLVVGLQLVLFGLLAELVVYSKRIRMAKSRNRE